MKIFVAAVLLMIAASTIFYIMVVSPKVAGLPEDEAIKVTTINNENIRLTMSVEKDWVHLGENLVINFEVSNESTDDATLISLYNEGGYVGSYIYRSFFNFDVYDENHVRIGTWPCPEFGVFCGPSWPRKDISPGGFYSENLVWNLAAYSENNDYLRENWDNVVYFWCPEPSSYERVELEPGTYYLEGHATHAKYDTYWTNFDLVTPLLEITILPAESI